MSKAFVRQMVMVVVGLGSAAVAELVPKIAASPTTSALFVGVGGYLVGAALHRRPGDVKGAP